MSIYKNALISGLVRVFTLPRLSIPLILTLGLTLGAVLTVVSISSTLLYQPLKGVHQEQHLKSLSFDLRISETMSPAFWNFHRLADINEYFGDIGTWAAVNVNTSDISINDVTFGVSHLTASDTILTVFGSKLIKGDGVNIDNPKQYIWISESLWYQAYDSDDNAIGQTIQFNNKTYIIAGVIEDVMAIETSETVLNQQVWLINNLQQIASTSDTGQINGQLDSLFVRTNSPTAVLPNSEQVLAWMEDYINRKFSEPEQFLDFVGNQRKVIESSNYRDQLLGNSQTLLAVLAAAVVGLLVMATLNLLNLFIAHYQSRNKELSMQLTLGASIMRVRLMVICENLPSFIFATVVGLLLSAWLLRSLPIIAAGALPMTEVISIDGPTLLIAGVIVMLLSIIFSQLALVDVDKKALINNLNASGKGVNNQQNQWLSNVLMVVQLSIASVLLTASVMLASQSYHAVYNDLGYDYGNSYEVSMMVDDKALTDKLRDRDGYVGSYSEQLNRQVAQQIEQKVSGAEVIVEGHGPLSDQMRVGAFVHNNDPNNMVLFIRKTINANYFDSYKIPFLAGSALTEEQIQNREPLVIIDEDMAKLLFPGIPYKQIIGQNIVGLGDDGQAILVNGIVGNIITMAGRLNNDNPGAIYITDLGSGTRLTFNVMMPKGKTLDASKLADLHNQFEGLAQAEVRAVHDIWLQQTLNQRISLWIIVTMTALTLLLAAIGVSGLTQMTTFHRKHELAIRMATGAKQSQLLGYILKDASKVLFAGLGLGLVAGVLIYQQVKQQIDLLPSFNWLTMTTLDSALIVIVLLSVIWPAWKVIKNDPMKALREP